jgi:hypothetical protein
MENILDSSEKKTERIGIKGFITPFIVLLLFIWSLSLQVTNNLLLNFEDYIAFSAVMVGLALYFLNKKVYAFLLAIIFFMGTFNLFAFTPYHYNISFGISIGDGENGIFLGFQPISIILLCIHLVFFKNDIDGVFKHSEKQLIDSKSEAINSFKVKFENKNINELEAIIKGGGYREEAVLAAKEIIKNKTGANNG